MDPSKVELPVNVGLIKQMNVELSRSWFLLSSLPCVVHRERQAKSRAPKTKGRQLTFMDKK